MNQVSKQTTHSERELFCRTIWTLSHLFFITVSSELLFIFDNITAKTILPWIIFTLITYSIWRPQSIAFTLLLGAQITFALIILPELQNHRYVAMFVNIGLLLLYEKGVFFHERSIWLMSKILVLVYFFAVFHKLNVGFLDPSSSCAVQFSNNLRFLFPWIPQLPYIEIYSVIIMEAIIFLSFLSQKTWKIGALLALLLHVMLSFDYFKLFINFTGIMVGLVTIVSTTAYKPNIFFNNTYLKYVPLLLLALLLIVKLSLLHPVIHVISVHAALIGFSFGSFLSITNSKILLPIKASLIAKIVIVIVFINAFAPYLGIKNRGSFNMYSNLLITNDFSNHLVIPRDLGIIDTDKRMNSWFLTKFLPYTKVDTAHPEQCIW